MNLLSVWSSDVVSLWTPSGEAADWSSCGKSPAGNRPGLCENLWLCSVWTYIQASQGHCRSFDSSGRLTIADTVDQWFIFVNQFAICLDSSELFEKEGYNSAPGECKLYKVYINHQRGTGMNMFIHKIEQILEFSPLFFKLNRKKYVENILISAPSHK